MHGSQCLKQALDRLEEDEAAFNAADLRAVDRPRPVVDGQV